MNITVDIVNVTAKPSPAPVIKAGSQVPVTITFSANPGGTPSYIALSAQSSSPSVLAYLDVFAPESETVYTGTLDANDSRLIAAIAGKQTLTLDCEIAWSDENLQIAPNFPVTVQPPVVTGPEATEGGPTYYTQTQVDALLAAAASAYATAAQGAKADSALQPVSPTALTPSTDLALAVPTGTHAAGDQVRYFITPTTGIVLTMNAAIKIPSDSTFTSKALTSGKLYIVQLEYSGAAWMLETVIGGY